MDQTGQEKLREGIAYFESIRQMMPEDRATLEFLCIAYEQTGDGAKYQQLLVELAQVLVKERDFDSAKKLLEKIAEHDEPEVKAAELKIRAMLAPELGVVELASFPAEKRHASGNSSADHAVAVKAEIELMEWLVLNGVVEKPLADKVCEQLRGFGSVTGDFLISALSVLENENPALAETACSCVADESKTPPISLELFDQYQTLAAELPEKLVKVRGAVPFGKIADELLIALANPMDQNLKREISARFDGKCHFFFVPPLSLGIVLGKLYPESGK